MPTLDLKKAERAIEFEVLTPINDTITEKRCFIAELARKALGKHFEETNYKVNNTYSLYNLPLVNEELQLIDFEINAHSVHVVATIDKAKNECVHIPKIYKEHNYKPDFFIFVNFSKTLNKMEIIGYLDEVSYSDLSIEKIRLLPTKNLINAISETRKTVTISKSTLKTVQELMFAYLEDDLSAEGKKFFLKYLMTSQEVRKNYKLFYTLNNDFVAIAHDRTIEKPYPEEESNALDNSIFYKEKDAYIQTQEAAKEQQNKTINSSVPTATPFFEEKEEIQNTYIDDDYQNDTYQNESEDEEQADNFYEEDNQFEQDETIFDEEQISDEDASLFDDDIELLEETDETEYLEDYTEEPQTTDFLKFELEENFSQEEVTENLESESSFENFAVSSFITNPEEQEEISEEIIEEEPIEESFNEEDMHSEDLDNIDEEFILEDSGEEELSLEMPEEDNSAELLLEETEETNLLLEESDDEAELLLELPQEETAEDLLLEESGETEELLLEEDPTEEPEAIEDISSEELNNTEEETPLDNMQDITASQDEGGEDLFSFLTDMADDPEVTGMATQESNESYEMEDVTDAELNDILSDNDSFEEIEDTPETTYNQEETQYNEINYQDQDVSYEKENISQYAEQSEPNPMLNANFGDTTQNEMPTASMFTGQEQSQPTANKSASKALFATFLMIALAGYGIYMYKDTILASIGMSEELPSMEDEMLLPQNAQTGATPPPPVDIQQPTTPENTAEKPVAPEPTIPKQEAEQPATAEVAPVVPTQTPDAAEPPKAEIPPTKNTTTAEKVTRKTEEKDLPKVPTTVKPPQPKNMNDAIANALAKDFNGVRISKVSWEISETLAKNSEVSRYLTITGKTVKSRLSEELLSATEPSFNNTIYIGINYRKDGSVSKVGIDKSSGSKQIDDIILKTVKDTLNYVKMPALNIDRDEYSSSLIIKL